MANVTQVLSRPVAGGPAPSQDLLPLVYGELRKLAAARLAREKPGQTLHATALVHEAYVRLLEGNAGKLWSSRGHFFGAAAEAMRRILVDRARQKKAVKHGGGMARSDVELDEICLPGVPENVLAIDEALTKLAQEKPIVARLVELKYFAGLTLDEAAAAIEISPRTAARYWSYAKAWLHHEISQ